MEQEQSDEDGNWETDNSDDTDGVELKETKVETPLNDRVLRLVCFSFHILKKLIIYIKT